MDLTTFAMTVIFNSQCNSLLTNPSLDGLIIMQDKSQVGKTASHFVTLESSDKLKEICKIYTYDNSWVSCFTPQPVKASRLPRPAGSKGSVSVQCSDTES